MQTVASFLNQSLAIIAPLLTAGVGLAPERVGNLSSLSSLGTVLFLLFGGPILARFGPVRMLQVGRADVDRRAAHGGDGLVAGAGVCRGADGNGLRALAAGGQPDPGRDGAAAVTAR